MCAWNVPICLSISYLRQLNGEYKAKGKSTKCTPLLTISATLTFSCNLRNTSHQRISLSPSFSHCVSHSVFLIGVQHPPTNCQERAPLQSSKPANYCLGRLTPQGPSQTSRTSHRALPRLPSDAEGKAGQTLGQPLPVLCCAFLLMVLTNTDSSQVSRGRRGRERKCGVSRPGETKRRGGLRGTNNTEGGQSVSVC